MHNAQPSDNGSFHSGPSTAAPHGGCPGGAAASSRVPDVRLVTACCLSLCLAACGGDRATPDFAARDSAGIRVVENYRPKWERDAWSTEAVPVLDVGSGRGGSPQLFRVQDILVVGSRIAILNAGSSEILLLDSIGNLIRRVGGRGDGPGEFARLTAVHRCGGDTLSVNDFSRFSLFDSNGDFLATHLITPARPREAPRIRGAMGDCNLLLMSTSMPPAVTRNGVSRAAVTMFSGKADGSSRDTLGIFPGQEVMARRIEGLDQAVFLPWGAAGVWAVDGDAFLFGDSEKAEIRRYERGKGLSAIIRWREDRPAVTSQDRDLYAEKRQWLLERFPPGAAVAPPLDEVPSVPAVKPFFRSFLVDGEGNLWVRRYPKFIAGRPDLFDVDVPLRYSPPPGREPESYIVFDRQGRWLADVSVPPELSLRAVHGRRLYGVWKDDLDVEHVRVHRLHRP